MKHKKVDGEEPGRELIKSSYSFQDVANLLGVNNACLYEIWKKEERVLGFFLMPKMNTG